MNDQVILADILIELRQIRRVGERIAAALEARNGLPKELNAQQGESEDTGALNDSLATWAATPEGRLVSRPYHCPNHNERKGPHHAKSCPLFLYEGEAVDAALPYWIGQSIFGRECLCSVRDDSVAFEKHHVDCPVFFPF